MHCTEIDTALHECCAKSARICHMHAYTACVQLTKPFNGAITSESCMVLCAEIEMTLLINKVNITGPPE